MIDPYRTLPNMSRFNGPDDLRRAFIDKFGLDWTASYIDQCDFVDSTRTILPNHSFAYRKILESARAFVNQRDLKIIDPLSQVNGPRHGFRNERK